MKRITGLFKNGERMCGGMGVFRNDEYRFIALQTELKVFSNMDNLG